jgi:hypothetical protein
MLVDCLEAAIFRANFIFAMFVIATVVLATLALMAV